MTYLTMPEFGPVPSCENRNDFLDRALVVPTVLGPGPEFFGEADL